MADLWFAVVAGMLVAYVVLDGFDLGAGVISFAVARNTDERARVRNAIGPYWDGNEVWLIAVGGALFAAFPRVLATTLSGFYLPIFFVAWTLIIRGISLELGGHGGGPLWRAFWDVAFAGSSGLLALLFGVVLGNLIRGVPLDGDGWFELQLFAGQADGVLDRFTLTVGGFAGLALAAHGAAFVAWKLDGELEARAAAWRRRLYIAVAVAWPLVFWFAIHIRPSLGAALLARPLAWAAAAVAVAGLAVAVATSGRRAFLGGCAFLIGAIGGVAACAWPVLLATRGSGAALSIANAAASAHSQHAAAGWLAVGLPLVVTWFVIVFRAHRGKSQPHD